MSKELDQIAKEITKVAKKLGIKPGEVNQSDLLNDSNVTEWMLRKYGGLANIKKKYFPVVKEELSSLHDIKEHKSYISKLESKVGNRELFQKEVKQAILDKLEPLPTIKPAKVKKTSGKLQREIVLMLNDTHYGLNVFPDEVNQLNSYSWKEASRRTSKMIYEAINYKPHARSETKKVHLVINGDVIAGIIHALTTKSIDLMIYQMNGALHILTHAISHLAENFEEVEIYGICGNHEDMPHKREGGNRAIQEKYDSFVNFIYYALSVAFRESKHIKFNFPKTPYVFFDLPAGRAAVFHGDTLFSKSLGNPGSSINVKALSNEIRKFNSGEVALGRKPIKLVMFGHVHTYAHFITDDGVEVYIAPSMSGVDGYAHSLTINSNMIGQVVFESTPKFIMGDQRLVRLNEADNNSDLDQLIPVYQKKLTFS